MSWPRPIIPSEVWPGGTPPPPPGGEPIALAHIANPTGAHAASAIDVADAGGYFASGETEGVLQEVGAFEATVDALVLELPLDYDPAPPAGTQIVRARGVFRQVAALTGVTVTSTAAETSLSTAAYTIPAGLLSTGDLLRLTAWGTYLQNDAALPISTIRCRLDAVTNVMSTQIVGLAQNAAARVWRYESLWRINAVPGFNGSSRLAIASTATATDEYTKASRAAGAAVVNLAVAHDLTLTVAHGGANATQATLCDFVIIEHSKAA